MGTVRNLQDTLGERPPPPASWSPRMGYQPRPSPPYRSMLPPVPWIIRGNNAALSLGAIVLAALVAAWWITN
jgi:hypothetical protein